MEDKLVYSSEIAPVEVYQDKHGLLSLYVNGRLRYCTKDKDSMNKRREELEIIWRKRPRKSSSNIYNGKEPVYSF